MLHAQMRNYEGFNQARHQLLVIRPQVKMNWFGLAVSFHLLHMYAEAEKVILAYTDGYVVRYV